MREAIALFAKAAIPGRVKTRLTACLSPEQAASLHEAFVRDAWSKLTATAPAGCFLFTDRPWPAWDDLAGPSRVRLQREGDLGQRMFGCFEELADEGFDRALIVGSDSPTLPAAELRRALDLLAEPADAVLGPAEDGGYYLVGCRGPRPGMFADVEWSSEGAREQTVAAFQRQGLRVRFTSPRWDVDAPDDLRRLRSADGVGPHVAEWLRRTPP